MKQWEKNYNILKIEEKISKLIDKRDNKIEEIKKLNEAINGLKDELRKYE